MDLDSAIKELHSLSSSSPKKTVRFAPDVERYFTLTPTHWKDGVRESDLKPQDVADCQSHSFKTKVFKETQNCRVCRDVIWNEGRCCKACKLPCHKKCEYKVLTACVSPERYPMLRNEEIKQTALNQRNAEERKYKMMSPGVEVKTTIKSSDGPVRYAFDLDVDYITERIIAMSFPSGGPEAQYRSNLKDVVNMLKTKHQNKYIIFNLSKRRNDIIKMNEQVLDVGWHDSLAPPLERLCSICKQIEIWLKKDSQNVIVLHCKGSRSPIGVVVLAYMNYINITANTETALDRYAMRRFMEAKTDKHVQPSQFRYEEYFTGLLTGAISINSAPLYLHHVLIHGVPNYDANGGCRPFLRIYQGMQTVFTSGVYTVPEGTTKFVISLDKALPLRGDILVKCYHKKFRSSTRDVIFRCQFHTTAVVEYRLLFGKQDLDDACTDARFPPFTKVEFIFSSTGDSLHNSDYVSNSNFPVDNGDDPLIRWDSYENFSKLVEGQDSEPDSPQPNGGNNNNLSPGPQKYIYASDGSPYAQVQKTPSFSKPQEPLIIPQSQTPVVHQQPPSNPQTNGPTRPYPYSNQNGHTGSPRPAVSPSGPPVPGNPVERTPSGRKMDFKEQRELEELLRGIEDDKGFQDLKSNSNQMPGSPQKSPIAESPGNRRIVSVHAELKNAPIPTKKTTPVRPIVEEEFENSPRNFLPSEQSTLTAPNSRHVEPTVTPQQTTSVHSTPPPRDQERTPTKTANESLPSNMQTLPNGNVPRDRVPGIPLEHANPTYDYTDKGRGDPNRTMGEVEEPLTEVRLKASPVQLHSLGESKTESAPLSRTPSNVSSNYEPQPLRAQQQKIRFITQYDETDHGGPAASRVGDQSSVGRPQQPDDGFQWLQKQQFKLKEQKDKDGGQTDRYSNPLLVREPGIHPSHQSNVHQRAPSSQPETISHPHGVPYQSSGLHSPGSSVKSEPVNNVSSRPYVSDNLSWLEQQQMKLREKRNRERLQMDPSYPLQVDTSYNTSQLPSQPSSISSVRSDVSGFSNNTPYSQRHPDSMATRRGHHPEPLVVGNQMQDTYQPSLRKGPPTPAFGYDNMASNQEVISPANGPLDLSSHGIHYHHNHHHHHRQIIASPAPVANAGPYQTTPTHTSSSPHKSPPPQNDGFGETATIRRNKKTVAVYPQIVRGTETTQRDIQDSFDDVIGKHQLIDNFTGREQNGGYPDTSEFYRTGEILTSHIDQSSWVIPPGENFRKDGSAIADFMAKGNHGSIDSENGKSKEHDSGYSSSATDASSNKSQSPKSTDRGGLMRGSDSVSQDDPGSLSFHHQASYQFLQSILSGSSGGKPHKSISLEDVATPDHSKNLEETMSTSSGSNRTNPPGPTGASEESKMNFDSQPSYDWVMNRIRELRNSSDRAIGTENTGPSQLHSPRTKPSVTPSEITPEQFSQSWQENLTTNKNHSTLDKESNLSTQSAFADHRSSRPEHRRQDRSPRSSSETREYTPRSRHVVTRQGHRGEQFMRDLMIQERSVHVHRSATNTHASNTCDNRDTNPTASGRPARPEKSVRVRGNPALIKELDDAMRTLQIWGDRIQALSSMCKEDGKNKNNNNTAAFKQSGNPSVDPRPYHQDHQTPVRSPSQNQGGQTVGTRLFIDEPLSSRSKGDIEANANNSANVYRPNKYALDTSLPSKSAVGGSRPVNRSNSLGGYESDSAIQYRPSKGEAESWIQNPGALPSQESEYWNRIEGLRSPGEKSPRDMHSSNESLPNGGTTPKFPVGPKGYANMVRTCIAVVGKPPHGPDDPLPLSPKREDPAADEFDVSFPRYPEPARKLASDTRPTPAQEPPLQIRHLEPAQFQFTEVPAEERPSHSVERIPHQDPLPAESRMRTPVSDARVPSREGPIDVKSLEMLLESVSPIEARGGVPDRPTSPWSHPDVGGKGVGVVGPQNPSSQQKRQEPEIHYAQVDIEQTTPTQLDRPHEEPVKYAHIQVKPNSYQQTTPTSSSELSQTPSIGRQNHLPAGYQPSYKVPVTSTMQHPVVVEEPISKTHLSPAKVVIEDIPLDRPDQTYHPSPASGQTAAPPPGMPIDAKVVIENRQQVVNSSPSHVKSPSKVRPMSPVGNPGRQPTHPGYSAVHPSSSGSPNIQQTSPHYMQPQRAVIEQSSPQPQHEQYSSPQHRQAMLQEHIPPQQYSSPLHVSPLQVRPPQQNLPPQQRILYSQEIRKEPIHQSPQYYPQEEQQYQPSSYPPQHQVGSPSQHPVYQQQPTYKQHQQQHRPLQQHQPSEPPQQQTLNQQQNQQQPTQYHQHPQLQRLQQQQSPGSDLPSISFSEATPPPKHVDQQESPIFQQTVGGEESSRSPDPQGLEPTNAPPPMYPTYSDRMKNRPQPLYPTFSDRHRRGHPRLEETFPNVANGNYKTLYDNRAGSKGRGSSGSDGSAVSPGTTSPVRQAVSPAGPSPIQSGRSTPSNFYLMPFASPYGSNSSLADPNKEHVRFVKDLSSWWYKPHISREEAIGLLRDKQPGTFVVRDSNSFPGAFGLAIKVAQAPANAPPKKGGDPGNELIRHFLIEPNNRGVRLKGCTNEPIFGSLSALIYQHTLTQLALPCKLVLPDVDPSGGVDSPDAIDPKSAAALLQQGAACSVLYLQCVDMESLTGPSAVREAITRVMNQKEKPKGVKVHFKVSLKGVTLTDSARKLFFRKHFPVESILYCGMDPGSRKFPRMAGQDDPDAKCFGFVSRKPGSLTDNQCMVFAEYEMEQPASAIVSFVTKVLLGSKQIKTP